MRGRREERVAHQVWVLDLFDDLYVVELDVKVLVDALERSADLDVVLELHRHLVVDEGLEETIVQEAPGRTAVLAGPHTL